MTREERRLLRRILRNTEIQMDAQSDMNAALAEQVRTLLLDPRQTIDRARTCLAAADRLLALTEARR